MEALKDELGDAGPLRRVQPIVRFAQHA